MLVSEPEHSRDQRTQVARHANERGVDDEDSIANTPREGMWPFPVPGFFVPHRIKLSGILKVNPPTVVIFRIS